MSLEAFRVIDANVTHALLPSTEPSVFSLDLLGEALPKKLLVLFELEVAELLDLCLLILASLHLLLTIVLVVKFFRRVDQVKHVGANEQ